MKRIIWTLLVAFSVLLVFASAAFADTPQPGLPLSPGATWVAILGSVTPLVGYLLNHYAPWASERVKSIIHVVLAAVVGVLYKLASTGGIDFTKSQTWQYMGIAVVAALAAHKILYVPGNINTLFKGGSNAHKK